MSNGIKFHNPKALGGINDIVVYVTSFQGPETRVACTGKFFLRDPLG